MHTRVNEKARLEAEKAAEAAAASAPASSGSSKEDGLPPNWQTVDSGQGDFYYWCIPPLASMGSYSRLF